MKRQVFWFFAWLRCWAMGHTGMLFDDGYHICSRCGLHGYWSYRETSGMPLWFEYGNAGWLRDVWERMTLQRWRSRRERKRLDDELPF